MNPAQEAKLDQVLWATNAQYPPYGRAVSHPDLIDAVAANGRRLEAMAAEIAAVKAQVAAGGGGSVSMPSAADIAKAIIAELKGA